ncbi:MAG: Tfp pilus assembly protein FimT/FimU [Dongiaceae bacterium]
MALRRGFSLLEMLLVLGIVALGAALTLPRLTPKIAGQEAVINYLRAARLQAIESHQAVKVYEEQPKGLYTDPPSSEMALPESWKLDILHPKPTAYLPRRLIAVFFPDGTALLSQITVSENGATKYRVEVHPFHGRVSLAPL